MPFGTYAIFRSAAQLTPQMLLPAQQYQLGGTYTVRGYKEGQFVGDAGYLFSAEWRTPFVLFPKTWTIPKTDYKLRDNIQLVSFADFGGSFTNSPAPGIHSRDYALGTGVGIRANLTRHIAGRVDLGVPLKGDSRSPRVHFGLETRLF
jgi:hemolysin activation/secretion protein